MRVRLREKHPDEAAFYTDRYPQGYDHRAWPDHVERIDETVQFMTWTLPGFPNHHDVETVADLSCGDGSLALRIVVELGQGPFHLVLGDVNPAGVGTSLPFRPPFPMDVDLLWFPIQESVRLIEGEVDLFVCSETLEHLDDPDGFLATLRPKVTGYLLVTTPEAETTDGNPEHYWGWDSDAVGAMLAAAGFTTVHGHQVFTPASSDVYRFQMWMVS